MIRKNKILVVAAHPDDEILGCGATMYKLARKNCNVSVLILGKGIDSRANNFKEKKNFSKKKDKLIIASKKANKILGVKNLYHEDFPDNEFDTVSLLKIIKLVEKYINKLKPDTIFTHSISDLNVDHRKTIEAVITATRTTINCPVKNIFSFEIPSSTDWAFNFNKKNFQPNYFINIENELKFKLKALNAYKSEMRKYPNSRSIKNCENIARTRGSTVGLIAAESFELIRSIEK